MSGGPHLGTPVAPAGRALGGKTEARALHAAVLAFLVRDVGRAAAVGLGTPAAPAGRALGSKAEARALRAAVFAFLVRDVGRAAAVGLGTPAAPAGRALGGKAEVRLRRVVVFTHLALLIHVASRVISSARRAGLRCRRSCQLQVVPFRLIPTVLTGVLLDLA